MRSYPILDVHPFYDSHKLIFLATSCNANELVLSKLLAR